MEKKFRFDLKTLPDFTLAKYQSLNLSDFGKVSSNNLVFIKQLHSLGLVCNMDFHLFYSFDPKRPQGERLAISLLCRSESDDDFVNEKNIRNIISSFAQSACYKLEGKDCADKNIQTLSDNYNAFAMISKKQYATNPRYANVSENGMFYYSVSEWKLRRDARMYNTLKLLEKSTEAALIRIDIFPVEDPNDIINEINRKNIYSKIQTQASFKATTSGGVGTATRDEAAGKVASFYDNYFKTMSASIQFRANICVFASSEGKCRLLGDVLISEVLESGLCEFESETESFEIDYKLDVGKKIDASLSDIHRVSDMKRTFTAEELSPLFSFPYLYPSENLEMRKETDPHFYNDVAFLHLGHTFYADDNDIDKTEKTSLHDDDEKGYPVNISLDTFAKHAYICGVPGSGKTYSMKHIIHTLHMKGIPFLVFEPAKREYRGLYQVEHQKKRNATIVECEKTDDIILLSPKTNSFFPLHINPFEIPEGVSVNEYISVIDSAFKGAFNFPQPTPMILRKAIIRAYESHGFHGYEEIQSGETRSFPVIRDLYDAFEWIMKNDSSYKGETLGNIRGILETRIGSLMIGDIGEVFNTEQSSIRPQNWNKNSIIVELESLSNEHANFITLIIISLIRLDLKLHPSPSKDKKIGTKLRHVIFFEEAHNLIGKISEAPDEATASSKIASTAFIKNMLAEVRAYGQGIVIADQLPTAIAPEVLKNTSIKIALRQAATDEREAIGSVMSADAVQIEKLSNFTKGQALVNFESDDSSKPFYVKISSNFDYKSETLDDIELAKKMALTSNKNGGCWYMTMLYVKSIEPRLQKAEKDVPALWSEYSPVFEKYVELFNYIQNFINGTSKDASTEKRQLSGFQSRFSGFLSRANMIEESVMAVKYLLEKLDKNGVGKLNSGMTDSEEDNISTDVKRLVALYAKQQKKYLKKASSILLDIESLITKLKGSMQTIDKMLSATN